MLRSVSTNTLLVRLTIQLRDSRPTPTSTPRIVASAMPAIARRIVLTMPAHSARPLVSGLVSMPEPRSLPSAVPKKSYPVAMSRSSRLFCACEAKKNKPSSTRTSPTTCESHLTTVASR